MMDSADSENSDNDNSDEDPMDPAEAMLQRGAVLRQLRELERQDEEERRASAHEEALAYKGLDADNDSVASRDTDRTVLACGSQILSYGAYLNHQRYYDDLKHVDCRFIDYGCIGIRPGRLVMEQDKTLGKGGWCWDAAFCLGEYLLQNSTTWKVPGKSATRIVELGTGTGLCGLMVAKAVAGVHVHLTDLPELMPLLQRNVGRNVSSNSFQIPDGQSQVSQKDDGLLSDYILPGDDDDEEAKQSLGIVSAYPLAWGQDDYSEHGTFDVIVGADVVASLYDPVALARTIWAVAHSKSVVYVSFKERLSTIHRQFEQELQSLFESIGVGRSTESRNRNPDIQILIAHGRKDRVPRQG